MTILKIIFIFLGIAFLLFGYFVFFRKKYNIINDFEAEHKAGRKDERYARRVGLVELIIGVMFLLIGILMIIIPCSWTERDVFVSPQNTNRVVVEYDFVSRPTVYKKTWFGQEKLWSYPGTGFAETVKFNVEWLSEEEIRISYDDVNDAYDEEFIISINAE